MFGKNTVLRENRLSYFSAAYQFFNIFWSSTLFVYLRISGNTIKLTPKTKIYKSKKYFQPLLIFLLILSCKKNSENNFDNETKKMYDLLIE